jgi:hypothetical protein
MGEKPLLAAITDAVVRQSGSSRGRWDQEIGDGREKVEGRAGSLILVPATGNISLEHSRKSRLTTMIRDSGMRRMVKEEMDDLH